MTKLLLYTTKCKSRECWGGGGGGGGGGRVRVRVRDRLGLVWG